ncbi:hypothetical protein DITRI_Ditri20bG0106300 [Diplodiscus trichospermus]
MMREQLEIISEMSSWLSSTSSWKKTLVISTIIFFAIFRLNICAKFLWFKDRLPVFTFHNNPSKVKHGETVTVPYCSVCLNEAEDGERLRRLPRCNHCFHVGCIDAWFQYRSTCPLCRNEVCVRRPQKQRGLVSSILVCVLQNVFRKMSSAAPPDLNFTTRSV